MNLQFLMNSSSSNSVSNGFPQEMTFIAPHSVHFLQDKESAGMEFQHLNAPMEQNQKMAEGRVNKRKYCRTEDEEMGRESAQIKLCARGHWRPHEDAKLKELVAQFGPQNWNLIAEKLQGRSGKSCRLRWFNQLDPRINRRAFTDEEEEALLAAHRMYGNKWSLISKLFLGRTDNAIKNHWHVIMARKYREQNGTYRRRKPNFSSHGFSMTDLQMCNASSATTISSNNLLESRIGLKEEEKVGKGPMANGVLVDQSGLSDSNSHSEVSASESVANNGANLCIFGEEDENGKLLKSNLAFIDFLGVGAT